MQDLLQINSGFRAFILVRLLVNNIQCFMPVALLAALPIFRAINYQPVKPTAECRLKAKLLNVLREFDTGQLRHIFRVGGIAAPAIGKPE